MNLLPTEDKASGRYVLRGGQGRLSVASLAFARWRRVAAPRDLLHVTAMLP